MAKLVLMPETPVYRVKSLLFNCEVDKQKVFNSTATDLRALIVECLRYLQNDWGGGVWRLTFDEHSYNISTTEHPRYPAAWGEIGPDIMDIFNNVHKMTPDQVSAQHLECLTTVVMACAHIIDKSCLNAGGFVDDAKLPAIPKREPA